MSKQYNISWRDKDVKELNRIVKNFNSKITRVSKKSPNTAGFLPTKISVKDLKSGVATRKDFNKTLKSLQNFSKRGSENIVTTPGGVTLSKYEIADVKNKVRIVNIKRAYKRKKLNITPATGNMGQVSSQNLSPKKFSLDKNRKQWDKMVESLEKETKSKFSAEQMELYKQNYISAIENFLGSDAKDLIDLIKGMDAEMVYQHSIENPILSIGFTSEPLPVDIIKQHAIDEWTKVLN